MPYCQNMGCAGVFNGDRGVEMFKCHHTGCPTGNKAFEQVGLLQHELNLHDRTEAAIAFMKEAGVWQEQGQPCTSSFRLTCSNNGDWAQSSPAAETATTQTNEGGADTLERLESGTQKAETERQQSAMAVMRRPAA